MSGVMDNYLSKEEQEYFNSGGEKQEGIEDIPQETDESDQVETGDQIDDDAENDDAGGREEAASREDEESDYESTNEESPEQAKKTTRDFEKAFKTERHKRKALDAEVNNAREKTKELEAQIAKMQEMISQVQNSQNAQQPQSKEPEIQAPDPEEDPLGFYNYKIQQLEKVVSSQNNYLKQQHETSKRAQAEQAFIDTYTRQAQDFSKTNQDFKDAYQFLIESRREEYVAAGYSQAEAEQLMIEDEKGIVAKAFQDKANAAERIYNLAKKRGYSAKSGSKNNVAAKNLDNIKKGVKNSRSLRDAGEPPEAEPGFDDIDDMSFDEFDKFFGALKQKSKGR